MTTTRPPIAIANYDFRSSGTVKKSVEIATAAHEAGLDVALWTIRAQGPLMRDVPSAIPIIQVAGSDQGARSRGRDLAFHTPVFARALRRHRPEILLSGGNHLHLAARAALSLSGLGDRVKLISRASNSANHGNANNWLSRKLERLKYGGSDIVVAVSQELAAEVRGLALEAPVRCIPNGVDIDAVARLSIASFDHPFFEHRRAGHPLLISMGRLAHQKGFDILISAMARLPVAMQARLLIVGNGTDAYANMLMRLAQDEGVGDRVALLGYQPNPFAIMARCDMFVSASRWEGASNSLIEALAVGLPLVATDCPTGNREVLEKGPFGTLSSVDDVDGLASAIATEWAIGRERKGQQEGAKGWSLEMCMSQWLDLLRQPFD